MTEPRRAYASLLVRTVDEERREIEGTASTPRTDLYGDVIEPLGVTFANPSPLLLYHDSQKPVGLAWFGKPTKDGLPFKARMARVGDAGPLRDRIEEAWQSIKAKLLRAVSIGFVPDWKAVEDIEETGGLRFLRSRVVELSLVAIPANLDATIEVIRTYDHGSASDPVTPAPRLVARRDVPPRSGVTDRPLRRRDALMTYSEQLTARRADLKTKSARLADLMQRAEDESRQLDTDQQAEADTLAGEVKDLSAQCDRLEALELAQARMAKPVLAYDRGSASDSRGSQQEFSRIEVRDPLPPGIEFARYVICKMASILNQGTSPVEIAKVRYPDHPRIQVLLRAAVAGATTTDGTWAGPLVYAQNLVSEFVEFLRPMTIIGKFGSGGIPSLRRVPFNVRVQSQTTGGSGYWVGQAVQKPLTKFDFGAVTLTWAKVAAISVIADELARFSSPSAELLVRDALAGALVERLDLDFVDPTKAVVANVSPASITNAATPVVTSGTDADAVRADIAALIAPFIAANISLTNGVFILPNTVALNLSLMRNALGQREFGDISMNGGTLEGFPVITSQYAAVGSPVSNLVILVSASDVFLSDDGAVSVDASREASLEMSDDPANEAGTVVSMYQTNQIALKAERYINWSLRRAAGVQYMADVAWSTGS